MRSTTTVGALAVAALAISLVGCSGPGGGGELTYEDSPLSKYLASAWGGDLSPEEQEKKFADMDRKREELVAKCMTKEGFEYKPNLTSSTVAFSSDGGEWDPDNKEWVAKYGYGMINSPFMEQAVTDEEYVDVNQEYIDSLSESERTAYSEALHGAIPDEEELNEDGSYEYNWETAGCYGSAQHEIGGIDVWSDDQFKGLTKKMEELWTKLPEVSEIKELDAAWSACMAEAGESGFTKQADASSSISDEQTKLFEAAYGTGTEEIDPEKVVDPMTTPEMKELGEREIALAVIDLDCREKTSYRDKSLKVQFAMEEKFIAENKAELDAFKAAAEQSK